MQFEQSQLIASLKSIQKTNISIIGSTATVREVSSPPPPTTTNTSLTTEPAPTLTPDPTPAPVGQLDQTISCGCNTCEQGQYNLPSGWKFEVTSINNRVNKIPAPVCCQELNFDVNKILKRTDSTCQWETRLNYKDEIRNDKLTFKRIIKEVYEKLGVSHEYIFIFLNFISNFNKFNFCSVWSS